MIKRPTEKLAFVPTRKGGCRPFKYRVEVLERMGR